MTDNEAARAALIDAILEANGCPPPRWYIHSGQYGAQIGLAWGTRHGDRTPPLPLATAAAIARALPSLPLRRSAQHGMSAFGLAGPYPVAGMTVAVRPRGAHATWYADAPDFDGRARITIDWPALPDWIGRYEPPSPSGQPTRNTRLVLTDRAATTAAPGRARCTARALWHAALATGEARPAVTFWQPEPGPLPPPGAAEMLDQLRR